MGKKVQPNICVKEGDVAKYVILGGDPDRIKKIASYLDNVEKVADHRGYVTYTGEYDGIKISTSCHGVGAPSAAVVIEELAKVGAKNFIRVGTTGAIQPGISVGNLIIATGAVRGESLTSAYVGEEYPATPDIEITNALINAADELSMEIRHGIVATEDAFYASKWKKWSKKNVLSVEMECSAIFTLSKIKNLKSGAILTVDGNLSEGTKKSEFEVGENTGDFDKRVINGIEKSIEASLRCIKLLEG